MQPPTYESPNHQKTQIEGKLPVNDARNGKGNVSEVTTAQRCAFQNNGA